MKYLKTVTLTAAIVAIAGTTAFAKSGALDVYMPGDDMGGGMMMNHTVFSAFFSDSDGTVARSPDEFMKRYNEMGLHDRQVVQAACRGIERAQVAASDRISPACKAAGF